MPTQLRAPRWRRTRWVARHRTETPGWKDQRAGCEAELVDSRLPPAPSLGCASRAMALSRLLLAARRFRQSRQRRVSGKVGVEGKVIRQILAALDDTVWRHDEERGRMTLVATKAAFAALGIDSQETPAEDETESAPDDTEHAGEESKAQRKAESRASRTAAPRSRDGSKQATHCHAAPGQGGHRR